MSQFRSLTSRLVLTLVLLVLAVCVLLAGLTTVAMRTYLVNQLDEDVRAMQGAPEAAQAPGPAPPDLRNRSPGSLVAVIGDESTAAGVILGDTPGDQESVDRADLARLASVPVDGEVHTVEVDDAGDFRVMASEQPARVDGTTQQVTVVTGLPTDEVESTVTSLLAVEVVLGLVGVAAAGCIGLVLVRRQLRPLREVASTAHTVARTPLDAGEVELTTRVPAHLTRPDTEVGQVGGALNTMLAHIEEALSARHRSEQQVRQFVADASHELRTPLATIRGYTELAARHPENREATDRAITKVADESERMTHLVEDLLLLARLDAGRPLERHPVDLTQLLVEAVSDARVVGPEHHWRLVLPEGEEPAGVIGDEQRLHQVISNLLTNARRHTPAGTTVTATVVPGGFTVHDDGPGFPAEILDRAFDRFVRGDPARQRTGGAGLGLSLVWAIVTAHGGEVSIASVPGDTTITVRLPGG